MAAKPASEHAALFSYWYKRYLTAAQWKNQSVFTVPAPDKKPQIYA